MYTGVHSCLASTVNKGKGGTASTVSPGDEGGTASTASTRNGLINETLVHGIAIIYGKTLSYIGGAQG
jgi:hypothetical protein